MPIQSAENEIQPHLQPGERLLWAGFPVRGVKLRGHDAFAIPFSVLWCGFAVFWTIMATSHGAPTFFILWGLMFVGIGLYFVFGRFVTDAKRRGNTVYGITDQRVLIATGLLSRELRSLNLRAIPEVSLKLHNDRTGTITFGSASVFPFMNMRGWPGAERMQSPAFEFIANPHDVHRLILEQQQHPA